MSERKRKLLMAANLEQILQNTPDIVGQAAQFADRRLRLSGGRPRVLELAFRAVGLAAFGGAVRPVAPHGRPLHQGPGRAEAALGHDDQLAGRLGGQQGQAVRPDHALWPRDRRRHHLLPGARRVRLRRPRAGRQLAEFHAETGGYDVDIINDRARRAARWASRSTASRGASRSRARRPGT